MQYGTFWQRVAASLVDVLVTAPVGYLAYNEFFLTQPSKLATFTMAVVEYSFYLAYTIYLHGRYGQTLGKRLLGIRLMATSGQAATWGQAWTRSSVDIALSVIACAAVALSLGAIPDDWYYTNDSLRRQTALVSFEPEWLKWTNQLQLIWFASEFVTMLLHPQRRAVHDLIAGTVVVRHPALAPASVEA